MGGPRGRSGGAASGSRPEGPGSRPRAIPETSDEAHLHGSASPPLAQPPKRSRSRRDVPAGTRRLVSMATAAAHADVSVRTLRRYIAQGRLTGYRLGPRLVKVDLNEVDRLAQPIPNARASASTGPNL